MTSGKKTLEIRNLNFYYGAFQGLKNINLSIDDKKVTAFIGPSAAANRRCCAPSIACMTCTLVSAPKAKIMYHGKNILEPGQDVNMLRAKVGMVFQKPTPFPMSVYDNIAFGVRLYENLPKGEMDERVEWALNKAALWTEVKDKLQQERPEPVRRPAATLVYRPRRRGQAGCAAAG
jgi:phosphate transport system ATP-binding protein